MMSKNLKGCSEGKMCLGVQRLECWYLCISGGAVYNSDFTPVGEWYLLMHGWFHGLALNKVLEWLSVRFRQEMSVVKCHHKSSPIQQHKSKKTSHSSEYFVTQKKEKGKWCPSLAFNWQDICVLRKGNLWCKASSVALSRRKGSHSMAQKLKNRLQHLFQELSHGALSFVKLNPWFLD